MNAISSNFTDEGKTFSKPWKPLSPATVAIKRELRKQGKSVGVEKPLLRTGLLKRSFGFNLIGKKQSNIYNNTDYAIVHQEGGTVLFRGRERKVPKRVLADVDDKRVQMVGSTFETWINGLIQKYKAGQA
jgi:phage gpG-like protein